jgi:mono/diheme cytochrome c family protein
MNVRCRRPAELWRIPLACAHLVLFAVALMPGAYAQARSAPSVSPQRDFLTKYCVTCHNERLHTAGIALDKIAVDNVSGASDVWERVVHKLRAGEMPPAGMPQPDKAALGAIVTWLETGLDRAAAAHPNPGRVPVHRLNRDEYTNAIRDLLAVDIDGRSLLVADDSDEHGFENIAGALSVSPALLERYLSTARKISRLAVGDSPPVPVFETFDVPGTMYQNDRMSEDQSFGSRGGIAIHYRFPVDAQYVVKVRLFRQVYDYIIGMGRPQQLEVRLDGRLVKGFTVGGENKGTPAPASYAGNIPGDPEWEEYMHFADANLQVRFPVEAGTHVLGVSFVKQTTEPEGVLKPTQLGFALSVNQLYEGNAAVQSVAIGGPYDSPGPGDTASRRRIFVCQPSTKADELPCAKKILATVARGAYRRPLSDADVEPLISIYEVARKHSGFEAGIESAITRILTDPEFLFRIERDPAGARPTTVYRLNDLELASRLSFFLWSSIPDEELLSLASRGKLRDSAILQQQLRRMLADSRSKALIENFASDWLGLPKLRETVPDPAVFPDFDENLRDAFRQETELFLENQLSEDHSIDDLLSADYTFVNERLARHYGIPDIYGSRFRRVKLSNGERGGLLGQGSVLTVTSYANRTSPVLRGKWLLANILGTPPPPPPPNVPLLKETGENGKRTSVRERMEQHRKDPACAGCHVRMDPLGFSLENFDATGKWRSSSDGAPINATGELPDGTQLEGVAGLRKMLLSHREEFASTFTEKLLTYALGREIEYFDFPSIRKITRDAAANQYRWSSIIEGIVMSVPFQMSITDSASAQARAVSKR